MAERARAAAEHGLRVLRVALRKDRGLPDRQLRFRISDAYAFDEVRTGWAQPAATACELELAATLVDFVDSQAVAALPLVPHDKLERKADRAVQWMDRAVLATEPLIRVLYLFFALETLLGDTSESLKAGLVRGC